MSDHPYHAVARDFADHLAYDQLPNLGKLFLTLSQIATKGSREETMRAIQYGAACVDYAMRNQPPEEV